MTLDQINKIKSVVHLPYLYVFLAVVIIFTVSNIYFNEIYVVGWHIFKLNPFFSVPYMLLTIINTILIGISFTLAYIRFEDIGILKPGGTIFSFIGSFIAILTGACPGCISGLLPVFAGFFGSSLNLNSLPFYGLEIQLLSTLLLLIGINQLSKGVVCKL